MLKPSHWKARLTWVLEHKHWTIENWKRVNWSDRTKINRVSSDSIVYTQEFNQNRLCPHTINDTVKFGGRNMMIWGRMSCFGTGGKEIVTGRINSEQMISILDTY